MRDCNYNVKNLSLEQTRLNLQVVRLGDSEILRKIRRLRNSPYTPEKLSEILELRTNVLGSNNAKENRQALIEIENQIDNLLFIEDVISIKFQDSRHYRKIIKNELKVNGKSFVRLLCSAGMARANTVLFANEEIIEGLQDFLNCGRDTNIKLTPSKYSAYVALASSATNRVSTPIFCIIPDLIIKRNFKTDYISESPEGIDATIEQKEVKIETNIFDGQGLLQWDKAKEWADELGLEHLPSAYIFRGAFLKGLLVTTDFKRIAEERGVEDIIDIYGNKHNIFDIDAIISASQFKMIDGFTSIEQFREETKKRDFGWGVTRWTPKSDKETVDLTYQYIQAINIKEKDIPVICDDTLNWLSSVREDTQWTLLFLLGELVKEKHDAKWFKKISDPIIKALLLNPEVINDVHIKNYIQRLVHKIETEAMMGTLRVPGNYSFLSVDPIAQIEHTLGLPVKGIIQQGKIYSNFWNNKNIDEVTILRSPTTWRSEIIKVELQNDDVVNDYLRYSYSNLVFNIYDDFLLRLSGADLDGDIALSTPTLNKYVYNDYLIPSYNRETAEKKEIDISNLYKSDIMAFGSRVGLLTNAATSLFGMLCLYRENSVEYQTIINRLKISNSLQQQIIDSAKGIKIFPFPNWWLDRLLEENKEILTDEEIELYNKLRIRQRPFFMKYVYKKYNKDFRKHNDTYENLSQINLGMSFKDLLLKENKNEEEQRVIEDYFKYNPLLDSPSPMNLLCHFMENKIGEIKKESKNTIFDYNVYINDDVKIDEYKLNKMRLLYKEFSDIKRNKHDTNKKDKHQKEETIFLFRKKFYEISSDISELTNLAVIVCYGNFPKRSKEFLWKLLPTGVTGNLNKNNILRTIEVPFEDEKGDFQYLNKKYSFYTIDI